VVDVNGNPPPPVTDAELDTLDAMIARAMNPLPEEILRLQPDPAGYLWSKPRNALQHYADPWMLARLAATIRGLRGERP
jgi:hypothetical protein